MEKNTVDKNSTKFTDKVSKSMGKNYLICSKNWSKALSFCFISESLGDFPIDPFGKGGNDAISQDYIPYEIY